MWIHGQTSDCICTHIHTWSCTRLHSCTRTPAHRNTHIQGEPGHFSETLSWKACRWVDPWNLEIATSWISDIRRNLVAPDEFQLLSLGGSFIWPISWSPSWPSWCSADLMPHLQHQSDKGSCQHLRVLMEDQGQSPGSFIHPVMLHKVMHTSKSQQLQAESPDQFSLPQGPALGSWWAILCAPKSSWELVISPLVPWVPTLFQKANTSFSKSSSFFQQQPQQSLSAGMQAATMNYPYTLEPVWQGTWEPLHTGSGSVGLRC